MMQAFPDPLPVAIRRLEGDDKFFVVEDISGDPLVFSTDEKLIRLCFAAPGMLHALESIVQLGKRISPDDARRMGPELFNLVLAMVTDANAALQAGMRVAIEA